MSDVQYYIDPRSQLFVPQGPSQPISAYSTSSVHPLGETQSYSTPSNFYITGQGDGMAHDHRHTHRPSSTFDVGTSSGSTSTSTTQPRGYYTPDASSSATVWSGPYYHGSVRPSWSAEEDYTQTRRMVEEVGRGSIGVGNEAQLRMPEHHSNIEERRSLL